MANRTQVEAKEEWQDIQRARLRGLRRQQEAREAVRAAEKAKVQATYGADAEATRGSAGGKKPASAVDSEYFLTVEHEEVDLMACPNEVVEHWKVEGKIVAPSSEI